MQRTENLHRLLLKTMPQSGSLCSPVP